MAMASSLIFLPALLLLLVFVGATASAAGARPATAVTTFARVVPRAAGLAERLEGEGPQQCWEALMDIKSCTGEIILFFLNGEAYLGPGCCQAIRVIEKRCWADDAMLSVIGFTPEEGDMLKGYCDAGDDSDGHHQSVGVSSAPRSSGALDGVTSDDTVAAAAAASGRKPSGALVGVASADTVAAAAAAAGRKARLGGAQLDG